MADPPTGQGPPSKFLAASTVADLNEGKVGGILEPLNLISSALSEEAHAYRLH